MFRRLWMSPFVALLLAGLVTLPACRKEQPVAGTEPKVDSPPTNNLSEVDARTETVKNFKQCVRALHSYQDATLKIPIHGIGPTGNPLQGANTPLLSWRVGVLRYMPEWQALYKEFKLNEPWDSEHNKKLIGKMPKVFASVAKPGKPGYTHMQMVIGPKAMTLPFATVFTVTDGTTFTIGVVEAAEPVIWTKPDDVMFPEKELPKDFRKKFGGQFPDGFYVGMWDGAVRFVPDTVSDKTLAEAISPNGMNPLGEDWKLTINATPEIK